MCTQEGARFKLRWRQVESWRARNNGGTSVDSQTVELTNTSQLIKSPGYPSNYANDLRVVWVVQSPPMTRIQVNLY